MGAYVPYDPTKEQFLNNFYTRFPSGIGNYQQGLAWSVFASSWNEPHTSHLRKMFDSEEDFQDYSSKYSDRYLSETPEAFFRELDATVTEVGLSLEILAEKIKTFSLAMVDIFESDEARAVGEQASKEMNDCLTPVYVALRVKGYNRKELWG